MRIPAAGAIPLLAGALLAGPAPALADPHEMLITVTVSGAVNKTGAYHHAGDPKHTCERQIEVMPAPVPGSTFTMLRSFSVDFDQLAMPPHARFVLTPDRAPADAAHLTGVPFKVEMTAAGHLWQGQSPPLPGTIDMSDAGRRGTFRIAGLTSFDATGTITVEGEWHCPQD
ncbi:MAG TPA: hypothetical protein VJY39_10895 [Acidisphaera sp.]|nr:hypothetical protein [Acidisphaera sp.]